MPPKRKATTDTPDSSNPPPTTRRSTRSSTDKAVEESSPSAAITAPAAKKGKTKTNSGTTAKKGKAVKASKDEEKRVDEHGKQGDVVENGIDVVDGQWKAHEKSGKEVATKKGKGQAKNTTIGKGKGKGKKTERMVDLFGKYATDPAFPDEIPGEGIEMLFGDLGLSMEGIHPLLLSWRLKAARMGVFTRNEWMTGTTLYFSTLADTATHLTRLGEEILHGSTPLSTIAYKDFYSYLFSFVLEENQKSMDGEVALQLWKATLPPRYKVADDFLTYVEIHPLKGVSKDVWQQVREFCEVVKGSELKEYDEMDAWPSVIDGYAGWVKGGRKG